MPEKFKTPGSKLAISTVAIVSSVSRLPRKSETSWWRFAEKP
jgi:hypothetical protein